MNNRKLKTIRTPEAPKVARTFRFSQEQLDHIAFNGGGEYLRRLINRDIIGLVARGESDHDAK